MLRWLEEFGARVSADRFRVVNESSTGIPATLSLLLLDCSPPAASQVVCFSSLPYLVGLHPLLGNTHLKGSWHQLHVSHGPDPRAYDCFPRYSCCSTRKQGLYGFSGGEQVVVPLQLGPFMTCDRQGASFASESLSQGVT